MLKANSSSSAAATAVTRKKATKRPRAGAAENPHAMGMEPADFLCARMSSAVVEAVGTIE